MMNERIYQNIYDELARFIPQTWDKLIVYMEYGEESYSFSFYVKSEGKYIKCYDLPNVSDDEIAESFSKLDKIIEKERNAENDKWTNMTVVIENNGKMHADLDYTDLSEGTYKFKKEWKEKYLI